MENIEVKKRESNFELLRILAMVMIVISHFAAHGGFDFPNTEISINRLWIQLCEIGGVIGDNLFVLISGYYLIDKKNLNLSRILKMWLQMFMYSFIIYGIFVVFGKTDFKLIMFVKVLCPVTFEMWWFPSTYILMYLFSPLLNKTLKHISRNMYKQILLAGGVLWTVVPMITHQYMQCNDLLWFFYLYALAGYAKVYGFDHKLKWNLLLLSSFLVTFGTVIILDIIGTRIPFASDHSIYFYDKQYIFIVVVSLSIFLIFQKFNIKYSKIINMIAGACFGVYLISDHFLVNPFLWKEFFENYKYQESPWLIIYTIFVVIAVFTICTVIELFRQRIEKIYLPLISRLDDKSKIN